MQKAKPRSQFIEEKQRKVRKYKREWDRLWKENKHNDLVWVERKAPLFMGYKLVFTASELGKRKYGEALQEVLDEVAPFIMCNDHKFNFKDCKVWHGYWFQVVHDNTLEKKGGELWYCTTKNWFDKNTGDINLKEISPDGTAWSAKKFVYNKDMLPWLASHSPEAKRLLGWPKEKEDALVEKITSHRKGWKGYSFEIDGGFLMKEDYNVSIEKWVSKYEPILNGDLISMEDFYHKKLYVQDKSMWHLDEYRGCDSRLKYYYKSKRYFRKKGKTREKAALMKEAMEEVAETQQMHWDTFLELCDIANPEDTYPNGFDWL